MSLQAGSVRVVPPAGQKHLPLVLTLLPTDDLPSYRTVRTGSRAPAVGQSWPPRPANLTAAMPLGTATRLNTRPVQGPTSRGSITRPAAADRPTCVTNPLMPTLLHPDIL